MEKPQAPSTKQNPVLLEDDYKHSKVEQVFESGPGLIFGEGESISRVVFNHQTQEYLVGTNLGRIKILKEGLPNFMIPFAASSVSTLAL